MQGGALAEVGVYTRKEAAHRDPGSIRSSASRWQDSCC